MKTANGRVCTASYWYEFDVPLIPVPGVVRVLTGLDLAPKCDPLGTLEKQGFHGGHAPHEKIANSAGDRSPRAL